MYPSAWHLTSNSEHSCSGFLGWDFSQFQTMKLGSLGDSCMIQVSKKGIHIYFLPVPFVCRKMSGTANLTTSPLISIYNQPSKDDVGASQ